MTHLTSSDPNSALVACCGLYCGNCKRYTNGKCPGCRENEKASWCKARKCCIENGYRSCADCMTSKPEDCPKFSNWVSSVFEFVFRSDRPASIRYIREYGPENYAARMCASKQMVFKKK